jgi:CheY-like chemotaxis protein
MRDDPPDLLVGDVTVPGMGGLALARRLRQLRPAASVILTSDAYADVDVPGVRFVPKPFDPDAMLRHVRRVFGEEGKPTRRWRGTRTSPLPGRAGASNG